jgi:hypothetical protein
MVFSLLKVVGLAYQPLSAVAGIDFYSTDVKAGQEDFGVSDD